MIDCFSRYVWLKSLKSKSAEDVATLFEKIWKKEQQSKNLQTDQGKEYDNAHFEKLMQKYHINHDNTYSNKKTAFAERVIET